MPVERRLRRLFVAALAVPVIAAVYLAAFGQRLWSAVRPGVATLRGATVIGTSRTIEKLEKCKELGMDAGVAVDDPSDFVAAVLEASGGHGADVVLDLVGAAYFQQNMACLAKKGRLLLVGLTSGAKADFNLALALQKRARIIGTVLRGRSIEEKAQATRAFVDEILPLMATGKIRPNLDRVFEAKDAAEGYRYVASNLNLGKVVLEFNS